jgi:tetratricopeptide (TPR) repeat protein
VVDIHSWLRRELNSLIYPEVSFAHSRCYPLASFEHHYLATMDRSSINIAIVEDNGMARMNLRNILLDMDFPRIDCFTHGRELKVGMNKQDYDLILIDFHLGDNRNGVEVVQELQNSGLLKLSTSVVFVTSDQLPLVIGQIVNVHPDALILKPYTIKKVQRTLLQVLKQHLVVKPILFLMDRSENEKALFRIDQLIRENQYPKMKTNLLKLRGRILIKLGELEEAKTLYEKVLQTSSQVMWAKWGLIQCLSKTGELERSQALLEELLGNNLSNSKACEWLAHNYIQTDQYDKAEAFLDKIKESDLTVPIIKLKSDIYEMQGKTQEAITLLDKKRGSFKHNKENFAALSLDLARCYINLVEKKAGPKQELLKVAKHLLGSAGRKNPDANISMKKFYMAANINLLEGDREKAENLLASEETDLLNQCDISTLSEAVIAWNGVENIARASEILHMAEKKLAHIQDPNESDRVQLMLRTSEQRVGSAKDRAMILNKEGMQCFSSKHFDLAIEPFYQAYLLYQDEPGFALNLLHSLAEAKRISYKSVNTLKLLNSLNKTELPQQHLTRLLKIADIVAKNINPAD